MNTQLNSRVRIVGAVALIALGVLFLFANILNIEIDFLGAAWPFFIIVPGVAVLAMALTGDKSTAGMIFPGILVTGTGLILLAQNLTGYWQSWAYIWAAYPAMVGAAIMLHGQHVGKEKDVESGRSLLNLGVVLLLGFGTFFELLIFRESGVLSNLVVPLLLIGIGGYLLFGGRLVRGVVGSEDKTKTESIINPELKRKIDEVLSDQPR
jgi:hypothetical protein